MPDEDVPGCMACDLTHARQELPGGRIFASQHWVVEHCIGPLPVGTLILKPLRHCLQIGDLTAAEAAELGPLLQRLAATVRDLQQADQVYVCLWSHAGWTPGHIHFVVQPSWERMKAEHPRPGPFLQADLFDAKAMPPREEVEAFANKARESLAAGTEKL
ncbi:MAG: hypothetical protein IIC89_00670 [Chloroflexi bacterium]|nr:hypothetical protein [Chloroflexota bacterium]